jgi:flagellar hook-associated protein 3 FlgL
MSTPRITQRLMVERSLSSMQSGMNRLARSQEQLSTGRLINRPSDSPTGTNDAMRLRAQLAADAQYYRNASDGLSYLGRTDNTLTTMVDNVRRARDLVVQGASTGSNGPDARAAIAAELRQIKESLVALANTEHMGRPLFGGTSTGPAYTTAGAPPAATYNGDDGEVVRVVGDDMPVKVNVTGREAFEVGGDDLFTVMDDTIAAMEADPVVSADIGDKLGRIDAVSKQMLSALADVGTRYGRVEGALATLTSTNLDNTAALSGVENVDIAKAVMDLQMAEVAHQAALGATARVLQPSLIDFLR